MTRDGTEKASLRVVRPTGTLRTQVVDTLRTAIIEGRFRSGERLVERRVCDLLGVSRTLVREALRQLEAEGLVENAPYRGPSVATVTAEQVQQIYEMRGALEGLAARLFVQRASDQEVADLARSVEAIADCYRQDDDAGQRAAVERFYDLLMRGARNDMLTSAIALHRARLSWLRAISLSRRERRGMSLEEKQGIVRAIAARDAPNARALAEQHVEHALVGVLEVLAADRAADEAPQPTDGPRSLMSLSERDARGPEEHERHRVARSRRARRWCRQRVFRGDGPSPTPASSRAYPLAAGLYDGIPEAELRCLC